MDRIGILQAIKQFEPVDERVWDVVKEVTGEYPDEYEFPDDLADPDAEIRVCYSVSAMGCSDTESIRIPMRYLWEGVPPEKRKQK